MYKEVWITLFFLLKEIIHIEKNRNEHREK